MLISDSKSVITYALPTVHALLRQNILRCIRLPQSTKITTWNRYVLLLICLSIYLSFWLKMIKVILVVNKKRLALTSPNFIFGCRRVFSQGVLPCFTPWLMASTVMKWLKFWPVHPAILAGKKKTIYFLCNAIKLCLFLIAKTQWSICIYIMPSAFFTL